ncbi:Isochorismatase domain-containing protein 2, mitochondrial [Sparganum proliferum]
MSTISKVGRLVLPRTALLVCDIQEKFRPAIAHFDAIVSVSSRLIEAARILQMQTIVTEMNPKGLGPTVPELGDLSGIPVFPKMTFSMMVEGVEKALGLGTKIDSVILCGIETHVCVQQTALDLRQRGIDVHCVADAVSSRNMVDRLIAFERMRQSGVYVTTSEAAILGLMSGADHPLFRTVQKLIIPPAPDSGLLSCDDGREKKQ